MRVGICSRYFWHEATEAAIGLARTVTELGHDVSILGLKATKRPVPLDPQFDNAVLSDKQIKFDQFLKKNDAIFWTHTPHIEQLAAVRRAQKPAFVFPLWSEWLEEHLVPLREATAVLAPFRVLRLSLKRMAVNAAYTGFSPGPVLCGLDRTFRGRILVPLYGRWAQRLTRHTLDIIGRVLLQVPFASALFLTTTSTLAAWAGRRLRRLAAYFPGRLRRQAAWSFTDVTQAMATSDIVFSPLSIDNTASVSLRGSSVGAVPLVADSSPMDEFWSADSAIMVPADTLWSSLGNNVGQCMPRHIESALLDALHDSSRIDSQRRSALQVAWQRDRLFTDSIRTIL